MGEWREGKVLFFSFSSPLPKTPSLVRSSFFARLFRAPSLSRKGLLAVYVSLKEDCIEVQFSAFEITQVSGLLSTSLGRKREKRKNKGEGEGEGSGRGGKAFLPFSPLYFSLPVPRPESLMLRLRLKSHRGACR